MVVLALTLTLGAGGAFAASTAGSSGSSGGSVAALKRGSSGPAVVQLQQKLHVTADGSFGPVTEHAVRGYQQRAGLEVDGVVGPQTASSLGIDLALGATAGHVPRATATTSAVPPILQKIAACESGGNPSAVSPTGQYRGRYQFDRSTWAAMGGTGDPAHASSATQDRLALKLYQERGTAPWPSCG